MMREKLALYGQWTYRGAWAIEIVAAILGLTTGIALGWQGYTASETGTSFEFVMASAPFFMVALAELTKIPIATLLFSAPLPYKPVLLLFLLGLAFITFETVFTGLERAATLRQLQYEELADDVQLNLQETGRLVEEVGTLNTTDPTARARKQYEALSNQWSAARMTILSELERVDTQQTMPPALRTEMAQIRERIEDERDQLATIYKQRNSEIDRERAAFVSQRDSFIQRINVARERNDEDYARQAQDELTRLRNPVPTITTSYQERIDGKQAVISGLTTKLDQLLSEIPSSSDPTIRRRRGELNAQLSKIDNEWQKRLDEAREQLAVAQQREANKTAKLEKLQGRITELNAEIETLERKRIPMARTDQIRRIASRFYGANPEDVSGEQADFVAVIWFGSLAVLAALTGPITAMVALGLQLLADRAENPRESKLARALRRLVVNWRFRRKETVKVEVPVERTVEKIVEKEVPVEKVIKEILYVPILTDDPEAVRRALNKKMPKEVADLVSVKMAGDQAADQPSNQKPQKRTK